MVPDTLVTLSQPKILELWSKIETYSKLYPEDPRPGLESFCSNLVSRDSVTFELSNGIVVFYHIEQGLRADFRMNFWDRDMLTKLPEIRELLFWAFTDLDLLRIGTLCADYETALARFITKRLGFTKEGVLRSYLPYRGRTVDASIYSLLREEYHGI